MSDIEDGELLSSDNEDCNQRPGNREEQEQKPKYKDKSFVDTNNNLQHNHNEYRNFHKNIENRLIKKKISPRSYTNDRKRNHGKFDAGETKRPRKSIKPESKEQEYFSPVKKEAVDELKIDHQIHQDNNQTKRRILCKYYAGGECKNGASCVFMHEDFPCKFFHDKASTCRAGNDCKYSHSPLSDDMQAVMDCFIQEGKDHKQTFSTHSSVPIYNTMTTVYSRTKCLLPTPTMNPPMQNVNQTQFNDSNNFHLSFNEFPNEETFDKVRPPPYNESNIGNYKSRYSDPIIRGVCPNNKSKFPTQEFRSKIPINNFPRIPSEMYNKKEFQTPIESNGPIYHEKYYPDFFSKTEPLSPTEININEPPPSCDIRINYPIIPSQITTYNNHAPARFIVGTNNQNNVSKIIEPNFDYDFKEALKKLADQVIAESSEMPLSPEDVVKFEDNEECLKKEEIKQDTSSIPEKLANNLPRDDQIVNNGVKQEKIEMPTVRIADNTSIFNINENELSESEKQYIEEMRSLINLDAQFENIMPWVAFKLEPVKKQPYILFSLKVDDVHESATSDPRLTGHPVLRAIENQSFPDEVPPNDNSSCHDEDDNESEEHLQIDLNPSKPNCDTRSYLYDCKFKRKKISGQIML